MWIYFLSISTCSFIYYCFAQRKIATACAIRQNLLFIQSFTNSSKQCNSKTNLTTYQNYFIISKWIGNISWVWKVVKLIAIDNVIMLSAHVMRNLVKHWVLVWNSRK